MDILGNGLPVIAGLIGVAGTLGFISAYFLSNRAKTTIELQDQEINAYKGRTQTLEESATTNKKITEAQNQAIKNLQELVTGKAATDKLIEHVVASTDLMNKLSERTSTEHKKMVLGLDKLSIKTDKTNQILTETLKANLAQNTEVNK